MTDPLNFDCICCGARPGEYCSIGFCLARYPGTEDADWPDTLATNILWGAFGCEANQSGWESGYDDAVSEFIPWLRESDKGLARQAQRIWQRPRKAGKP